LSNPTPKFKPLRVITVKQNTALHGTINIYTFHLTTLNPGQNIYFEISGQIVDVDL